MSLILRNRTDTRLPIELPGLTPRAVRGESIATIERRTIQCGNQSLPLGELFAVSGTTDDERFSLEGDWSAVNRFATGMEHGVIDLDGNAGRHWGFGMRGGELTIAGNAGNWLGSELRGGTIRLLGSAGDFVGASLVGDTKGMRGGVILVHGNVGHSAGRSMRRGIIAIRGDAGELLGHHMLAGTILVGGAIGAWPGLGMRRGTIALVGRQEPPPGEGFRFAYRSSPTALALTIRHLAALGFPVEKKWLREPLDQYHGDSLSLGRGEFFVRG